MNLNVTADDVCVDDDEGRICLIVHTDEGDRITVNIHGIALDFYDNVQHRLRPYALEAEAARRTMPVARDEHDDPGYALDDPKHPTYYERMVG